MLLLSGKTEKKENAAGPAGKPLPDLLPPVFFAFSAALSFLLFFAASRLLSGSTAIENGGGIPPEMQVFYVLSAAAFISFFALLPSSAARALVFALSLYAFCFSAQALGSGGGIYRFAFTAVIVQASFFFTVPVSLLCSAVSLILALWMLQPHAAFSAEVPGVGLYDGLYLCVVAALAFFSSFAVKLTAKKISGARYSLRKVEDIMDRLSATNLAYQNYLLMSESKAVEKERNRISREIHDIIGYTMTNVLMLIQAAIHTTDAEKKNGILENAVRHLSSSVDEARLVLRRLRERDDSGGNSIGVFFDMAATFQEITGIRTRVDFGNAPRVLPAVLRRTLMRMMQEALTNSFRHGRADEIRVSFWSDGRLLSVRIHDNGSGQERRGQPVREGIGIKGMRERVSAVGGHLSSVFAEDGFIVQAIVPLDADGEE